MKRRILIADDEPLARARLVRMIAEIGEFDVIAEAENGIQAIELIEKTHPDLVCLDISMPGLDGLSVAKRIAEQSPAPAILFCTAHDDFLLEAFSAQAVGYLIKPIRLDQLKQALQGSTRLSRMQLAQIEEMAMITPPAISPKRYLHTGSNRGVQLLDVEKISLLEADSKYVLAYHEGQQELLETSLRQLEQTYPEEFIRIHRNALVGWRHIAGVERNALGESRIVLRGVERKPKISRRHWGAVKARLAQI